jgi:hypothetical protein
MDDRSSKSLRLRVARMVLAGTLLFAALVWVSLNVWTASLGVVWHVFHGNFTSFEGHRIHVPWDMLVLRSADPSLTMVREAPTYPILRSPGGIVLIERRSGPANDMSKYYDRIARANEQPRNGYRFQGIRQLSSAKGTVYCWEMDRLDASQLSISCWFDKDTLGATYDGSPVYRNEFYKAIETVAGASSN